MESGAFVGRESELQALREAAAEASAGRPRVVLVEGAAGMGKTTLVRHARSELGNDFNVISAQADEFARDEPLWVVAQLVDDAVPAPFAAGMALVARIGDLQAHGPAMVVVEDLHWADDVSRQALLVAIRRLRDDRVLVVITAREDEIRDDAWERVRFDDELTLRIPLRALSVDGVAALARSSGLTLDHNAALRLQQHTAGHPLYVRTLLADLTTAQLTSPDSELPAPRSLASTTLGRLGQLPADAVALASALAVLGEATPLVTLGRVAEVAQPADALDALLTTGFVTWTPSDPRALVSFTHPLYRAAVYDDLSPQRRQVLHRAAAEVSDHAAALAHRVAATEHTDEDLARALEREAEVASSPEVASKYLRWSSALSAERGEAERRLLDAAALLLRDSQWQAAAALRDQIEACVEGPRRSFVLGMLRWHEGDAVGAERDLVAATAGATADVRANAEVFLTTMYTAMGRGADAAESARRVLRSPVDNEAQRRAASIVLALAIGEVDGAAAGLDALDPHLFQPGERDARTDAQLFWTRGMLTFYSGRAADAVDDLRTVVEIGRSGSSTYLPRAHFQLAQSLTVLGDWDRALINAHLAIDLATDERQVWLVTQTHGAAAALRASRGDWDDAARHIDAARAGFDAYSGEATFLLRIAEAALARAEDDSAAVVASLQPLVGDNSGSAVPMMTTLGWWPTLISAHIATGDLETAADQLRALRAAAERRRVDLRARILGLDGRLAFANGDHESARGALAEAVAAIGPNVPLLDRGELHQLYAHVLRDLGMSAAARTEIDQARALFESVGARPYLERIDRDAADAGVPTAPAPRGTLELTDREQDVVTLVARGMTNREVAAELYVSAKTVEYHLGNVFGKIGISSRRQLRDWVRN